MRMRIATIGLLLAILSSGTALAEDAAASLAARLQPMHSLSARFEQTVNDEQGALLQQGSGTMQVERPNRLRWATEEPFQYLVVTDGVHLWRYDADLEQANREAFSGELADAPGLILGGNPEEIAAQYQVEQNQERFVLKPNSEQALFRELILEWEGEVLRSMILVDRLDQTTRIEFSAVQRNPSLPASTFTFTPPEGTDVILHD